jgi:hypothetical protein
MPSCRIVTAEIATLCLVRYIRNPIARYATSLNVSPITAVTTAATTSISVIHACLDSRRVAVGVITAAQT